MGTTDSSLTNDPQSTPDADPVFVCTVCGTMDGNEWWGKPGVVLICGACLTAKRDAVSDPCPQCYGTGRYSDTSRSADTWRTRPCETCGGTGRVAKTATAQDFTALRQEVADQLAGIAERQAVPHFYGGDPTRPVARRAPLTFAEDAELWCGTYGVIAEDLATNAVGGAW